jgi:competence protein ComEC
MQKLATVVLLASLAGIAGLASQGVPRKSLDICYIDTEGGQSTLFVSPAGESLLVDTGNAGGRDLDRILEAIKAAGLSRIDHLWTTHYHGDHVGAMEELSKRVPVSRFYDHGPLATGDRATPPTFTNIRGPEQGAADDREAG